MTFDTPAKHAAFQRIVLPGGSTSSAQDRAAIALGYVPEQATGEGNLPFPPYQLFGPVLSPDPRPYGR